MYNVENKEYGSRHHRFYFFYISDCLLYGLRGANLFKKCKLDKNFSHEIYILALEFKFEIFQITRRAKTFHESGQNSENFQEIQQLLEFQENIRDINLSYLTLALII